MYKRSRLIFHPEIGRISRSFAFYSKLDVGRKNAKGYITLSDENCQVQLAHRLIYQHVYGAIPYDMEVDHINGIKHDNRIANLRLVNRSQNNQNRVAPQVRNRAGIRGVSFRKSSGRYIAQISANKKTYYLGSFATSEEASAAYRIAAATYHTHNPLAQQLAAVAA